MEISVKNFDTPQPDHTVYATTVGLYNERDELLVVGKLSAPYPIPPNTDMTFVVRYDS
jgi:hypothetical protein